MANWRRACEVRQSLGGKARIIGAMRDHLTKRKACGKFALTSDTTISDEPEE